MKSLKYEKDVGNTRGRLSGSIGYTPQIWQNLINFRKQHEKNIPADSSQPLYNSGSKTSPLTYSTKLGLEEIFLHTSKGILETRKTTWGNNIAIKAEGTVDFVQPIYDYLQDLK